MHQASSPPFFTVASSSASDAKWYAAAFTTERSHCFNCLTGLLDRYPTNLATVDALERGLDDHDASQLGRRLVLDAFPEYFSRLSEVAESGLAAGSSDAGLAPILTGLWLLWPEMRFLISFGDGVRQVDSTVREEPVPTLTALYEARHRTADPFEQACREWAASVASLESHRDDLRSRGAAVLEARFEQVAADPVELAHARDWLLDDRGQMPEPVTDTPHLDEPPAAEIWEGWTAEMKRTFAVICGGTQRRLGYALATASGLA